MYKDSRIYVAGHTGLLGSALLKKLYAGGYANIITRSHDELDLMRQEAVDAFFRQERQDYVFLCAGLTGGIQANMTYPATFLQTNVLNLGSGSDYSIRELADAIARTIGYSGTILWDTAKPDGTRQKLLDSSRFLSLGWKPSITFQKGLELTYQWFRNSGLQPKG